MNKPLVLIMTVTLGLFSLTAFAQETSSYDALRQQSLDQTETQQQQYQDFIDQQNAQQTNNNQANTSTRPQPTEPVAPQNNTVQNPNPPPNIFRDQSQAQLEQQAQEPQVQQTVQPTKKFPNKPLENKLQQRNQGSNSNNTPFSFHTDQWHIQGNTTQNLYGATLQDNPSQNAFEQGIKAKEEKEKEEQRGLFNIYAPTPNQPSNPGNIYR
ncbi:MAG: hypothetical protein AAGG80_04115 [Pseudomonadota bacterium]